MALWGCVCGQGNQVGLCFLAENINMFVQLGPCMTNLMGSKVGVPDQGTQQGSPHAFI